MLRVMLKPKPNLRPEEALVGDVALPRLGGLREAVDLVRVRVRVRVKGQG